MSESSFVDSALSWLLYLSCAIQVVALLAAVFCSKAKLDVVEKALQPKNKETIAAKIAKKGNKLPSYPSSLRKRKKN